MANIFSRAAQAQRPAVPAQPMRPRPALPQVAPAPNMTQMGVAPPTLQSALRGDLLAQLTPQQQQLMQQQQLFEQMQQRRLESIPAYKQMKDLQQSFGPQGMPNEAQKLQFEQLRSQIMNSPQYKTIQQALRAGAASQISPMSPESFRQMQPMPGAAGMEPSGLFGGQSPTQMREQPMPGAAGMQPSGLFRGQSPMQRQAQPQISPMSPESFRQRPPIPLELLQAQVDPQRELEIQRYRETLNTPQAISAHAGLPAPPPYVPPQPSFQPSYSPMGFGPTDGGFRPLDPNNPRLVNPMQQPAAGGSSFSGNWANAGNANQRANPFNQGIGSIGPSRTDTFNKFGGPFGGM